MSVRPHCVPRSCSSVDAGAWVVIAVAHESDCEDEDDHDHEETHRSPPHGHPPQEAFVLGMGRGDFSVQATPSYPHFFLFPPDGAGWGNVTGIGSISIPIAADSS
jgi:hypothetical protein